MVKKILLGCILLFALLVNNKSQAQTNYSFAIDSSITSFHRCDTTQEAVLTITNNSNKTDTLVWKRSLPNNNFWATACGGGGGAWSVTTCDNNSCYTAGTTQRTFYVNAHSSATITMNVTPNSVVGTGIIDLKIVNGGYLKDSISGYYKISIACKAAGINTISTNSEINIYPTPFQNSFTVASNNSTRIKFLEVYNIIGSLVYKQELNDETVSINPGNLPKGLYFVTLSDVNRKIISTKRIQKD